MAAGVDKKASNALTFAHELGHNLGMRWVIIAAPTTCSHIILDSSSSAFRHDFPGERPPETGWPKSFGCDKQGIMSYFDHPVGEWSECSRKDQESWFRKRLHMCMKADGGSSPGDGLVSCGFHKAKNCAGCPQVVHQYSF